MLQQIDNNKDIYNKCIDIYISLEQALINSNENNFSNEIKLLIIHGILHTIGYNDNNKSNMREMNLEQNRLLEKINDYI